MPNTNTPLKYQPFYCEENIWHLCQHPRYANGKVIFISSYGDYVPMLCQQGSDKPGAPILWDYHVVLLSDRNILDFNTTLGFSTPLKRYLACSFIDENMLAPEELPVFRVLAAKDYTANFQSDRRHMRTETGWSAPPPDWPCISESQSNLQRFTNMHDLKFGEVLSATQMIEKFA